jgi:hypothetical protein
MFYLRLHSGQEQHGRDKRRYDSCIVGPAEEDVASDSDSNYFRQVSDNGTELGNRPI